VARIPLTKTADQMGSSRRSTYLRHTERVVRFVGGAAAIETCPVRKAGTA